MNDNSDNKVNLASIAALVTAAVLALNKKLGLDMDPGTQQLVVYVLMGYIAKLGFAYQQDTKLEALGVPKPPEVKP